MSFLLSVVLVLFCAAILIVIVERIWPLPPPPDLPAPIFVPVQHATLAVRQIGQGPDLVLLHGWGASMHIWWEVAQHLANDFRITMIDLPGFGESSFEAEFSYDLDGVTEALHQSFFHLKLQTPHLIGSSMGGTLALWFAQRWPADVGKVFALSPSLRPERLGLRLRLWLRVAEQLRFLLNRWTMRGFLFLVLNNRQKISRTLVSSYLRPYRKAQASKAFFASIRILTDPRLQDLTLAREKVSLIWGERDRIVPISAMRSLLELHPEMQTYTHPSAGHHPMEDEPEWLATTIRESLLPRKN